jgi:hypothetical protein
MATKNCLSCGYCGIINRRSFLTAAGTVLAATQMDVLKFASALFAAEPLPVRSRPLVHAAFVRPDIEKYWMGWPGAAYDIKVRQQQYTDILTKAANELDVELKLLDKPLSDSQKVAGFLEALAGKPVDGVMIISMCLHQNNVGWWDYINRIAKDRGPIPTIIFSPMGTSFTGDLQASRNIPGVFIAATQDLDWLAKGLRMFKTIRQMKDTRICILAGDKTEDVRLDGVGTTLHYMPRRHFPDQLNKAQTTPQVQQIAEYYTKNARKIVEPSAQDILNAAKNYIVARQIMQEQDCQGISMDCLGLITQQQIPCPPCLAWSRLNDEGLVGACEADRDAAVSLLLANLLLQRPGFMQDPAPNTVNNTLMGAHCTCATKLDGFDKPPEPFILRSHSESSIGVSMQVLWRPGQKVTVMEFTGPDTLLVGTGRVLRNIDTPPAGGCRTSVEIELDEVPDSLDTKGFHQLFIYGDHSRTLQAYCQLAGIKPVHI